MAAPQNFVSVSRRPPDVEDYIDILRRYRSWIVGPTFAGLVIAMVVAFWWPDMYLCTAAMRITPSAVSANLMPGALSGKMAERVEQLRMDILSRDSLIILIKDPSLSLYKKEQARYPVEDIAEEMGRKHVHINVIPAPDNRGAQAFRIFFEYPDRIKAREVVLKLVEMFQAKNMTLQQSQASSAGTFLEDEVKKAKERMEHAQAEIANFASVNQGRLPENFTGNMLEVQSKNLMIASVNEQIGQERQRQLGLDAALSNNKNMQTQVQANLTQTITNSNQAVKNQNLINIEGMIAAKNSELQALLRRYQPDFPDVLSVKDQIKALEVSRDDIEKREGVGTAAGSGIRVVSNPQAAQQLANLQAEENTLKAALKQSILAVETKQKNAADLQRQLKEVEVKVAASPAVIQKFNTLQGDYALAKEQYDGFSKNKQQSDTQQSMEEHRAGETLDVLESPITPETATSPNRPAIVAAGTMFGLMLGIALAGAKEMKNTSLKNLKDVRAYTNLPVLSSIPLLENALLVRRKRRLAWLAWSSALIIGGILMCGAVYYHLVIAAQVS